MDKRTINEYLKILQDNDVLYTSSTSMGIFDVQTWIFGDYELSKLNKNQKRQQYLYQQL